MQELFEPLVYRPWICALAGTLSVYSFTSRKSIGLGYVHWPELLRGSHP